MCETYCNVEVFVHSSSIEFASEQRDKFWRLSPKKRNSVLSQLGAEMCKAQEIVPPGY